MQTTPFGRYQLQDLLGRGGMGHVYRAYDTATDRVVAIKVLPPHLADDPEFEQRFRREARIAAGLNDPHVVPIHTYGEIDGRLYVDMRLIEGRDLGTLISEQGGRLSASRAVAVVEQVAAALDTAHHAGLLHRDIKPSNILVAARDFVYLIDFGIARAADDTAMTGTGQTIGTLAYMAPERFSGTTDWRSDVYSLACVLHECLTGQRPYPGTGLAEQLAGHLNTPPPQPSAVSPGVPPALDAVIAQGMAKDSDDRYQSALVLANAARAALDAPLGTPASNMPPQAPTQLASPRRTTIPTTRAKAPQPSNASSRRAPKKAPPMNKQRRAAAKRELERQLELRAQQARRRQVWIIAGVSALVSVVIAAVVTAAVISHDGSISTTRSGTTSSMASTRSTPNLPGQLPLFKPPANLGANCTYPPSPYPASKPVEPPRSGKVPTDEAEISVSMMTDQGPIGLMLDNDKSPCTVNSFVSLAQKKFFDDTQCHRLTTAAALHVLQCGDPAGDGTGGPGYEFPNEYPTNQYPPGDPALEEPVTYPRGTLAMANSGPNTNGSQFFLVYQHSQLPPQYTVFGTVQETGLATLDGIAAAGVRGGRDDGPPAVTVTINSVRLD